MTPQCSGCGRAMALAWIGNGYDDYYCNNILCEDYMYMTTIYKPRGFGLTTGIFNKFIPIYYKLPLTVACAMPISCEKKG